MQAATHCAKLNRLLHCDALSPEAATWAGRCEGLRSSLAAKEAHAAGGWWMGPHAEADL